MKTYRILSALMAAALLACGCIREQWEEPAKPEVSGDRVNVNMGILMPEPIATKALGESPVAADIHLYLAVFDGTSDTLLEMEEAQKGTSSDPENLYSGGEYYFHTTLNSTTNGTLRIIQFIAASTSLDGMLSSLNKGDNEATFAEKLRLDNGVDAYWARLEMDHIGNDSYTTGMLSQIPMIRNFAKVTVNVASGLENKFQLVSFKVFNMPKSGMAVPLNVNKKLTYVNMLDAEGHEMHDSRGNVIKIPVKVNPSTGDPILDGNGKYIYEYNHFADYTALPSTGAYQKITDAQPAGQEYWGYMPANLEWEDYASEYSMSAVGGTEPVYSRFLGSHEADYIYESTFNDDKNYPFIILSGYYRDNPTDSWGSLTFYKADFVNASFEYYHILRNFQYNLTISDVTGSGSSNIYEAVQSIAMNNFKGSAEAQTLTNIANGQYQMYISRTSALCTYGTEMVLYIKNLEDTNNDGLYETSRNDLISVVTPLAAPSPSGTTVVTGTASSPDIVLSDGTGEWAGWKKATITVFDPDRLNTGEVRTQKVSFSNGVFTRTCELRIREPLPAQIKCEAYVPATKNSEMYIDISIPDGIRKDVFPLYFYFTVDGNTLYPDASDPSYPLLTVIPDPDHDSYYFERRIDWEEYSQTASNVNGQSTFRSYFKTAVDASATTVHLSWKDSNNYFTGTYDGTTIDVDNFVNSRKTGQITFEFSNLQLAVGDNKTILGTSNSGADISYFSNDESIATVDQHTGVVTAVSAGTTFIYATCPSKDEYTAVTGNSARYTVEVVSGTVNELTLKWNGNPTLYVRNDDWTRTQATATSTAGTPTISYTYSILEGPITDSEIIINYQTDGTTSSPGRINFSSSSTGIVRVIATATVSASGYATATQSIWYDIHVVDSAAPSGSVYYEESFLDSNRGLGLYTISGTHNTSLDHEDVWFLYTKASDPSIVYGAAASGYDSANRVCIDTDSYLVSESIDLYASTNPVLEFQHAGNYFTSGSTNMMSNYVKVWYRFSNTATASSWTTSWIEGTIDNYPPGYNWKYYQAHVTLDFSQRESGNTGKYVQIRFEYISDTSIAGTWEIKNVRIVEQ